MSMERIYTCNICRETKKPNELKGVYFKSNTPGAFRLSGARDTDGTHICADCMTQLKIILEGEKIG